MNLYRYVGNSPSNFRDPSGMAAWADTFVSWMPSSWVNWMAGEGGAQVEDSLFAANAAYMRVDQFVYGRTPNGWFAQTSNFGAATGDTVSGGRTRFIRSVLGYDDVVDHTGVAYTAGAVTGTVISALQGNVLGMSYGGATLVTNYADWSMRNQGHSLALRSGEARWLRLAGATTQMVVTARAVAPTISRLAGGVAGAVPGGGLALTALGGGLLAREAYSYYNDIRPEWGLIDHAERLVPFAASMFSTYGMRGQLSRSFRRGYSIGWEHGASRRIVNWVGNRYGLHMSGDMASPQQLRLQELRAKHGDVFRRRMAEATAASQPQSKWAAQGSDLASEIAITKSMMRHYRDTNRGVNLGFGGPKSDWNATQIKAYKQHLGEQMLELNRLSLFHPENLRYNISNYAQFESMKIIKQMWYQAAGILGPKPTAQYTGQTFAAGHWLDSVAGGHVWNFVGWRDGVANSTIGSRWAAGRVDQIVPGQLHWGN